MARIMTVDDSPSMRKLLAATLAQAGHSVSTYVDGQEAYEAVTAERFDLIISDVNMPRMDGLKLLQRIRALPDYRFTPLLLLTTEVDADKKMLARKAGATGWMVKPFDPSTLLSTIEKVLD